MYHQRMFMAFIFQKCTLYLEKRSLSFLFIYKCRYLSRQSIDCCCVSSLVEMLMHVVRDRESRTVAINYAVI